MEWKVAQSLANSGLLKGFEVQVAGRQIDAIAGKTGQFVVEVTTGGDRGKIGQALAQNKDTGKQVVIYGEDLSRGFVREAQKQGIRVAQNLEKLKKGCERPMKNLGLYLPVAIGVDELARLGAELGGEPIGESTLRFGKIPEEAYLDLATDLSNGCSDEDEFAVLQTQLGFAPASYVSIHLNYTPPAFLLSLKVAAAIQDRWGGAIDYSGAGGTVENPFVPPAS